VIFFFFCECSAWPRITTGTVLMLGMLNRLPVCDWNVVDVNPLSRLLKRLVLISTDLYLRIFSELKY